MNMKFAHKCYDEIKKGTVLIFIDEDDAFTKGAEYLVKEDEEGLFVIDDGQYEQLLNRKLANYFVIKEPNTAEIQTRLQQAEADCAAMREALKIITNIEKKTEQKSYGTVVYTPTMESIQRFAGQVLACHEENSCLVIKTGEPYAGTVAQIGSSFTNNSEILVELIKQNPNLPIVPFVDSEVGGNYCNWSIAALGAATIEEIYAPPERCYIKSIDFYNLVDEVYDIFRATNADEELAMKLAQKKVSAYPWERVIAVKIKPFETDE